MSVSRYSETFSLSHIFMLCNILLYIVKKTVKITIDEKIDQEFRDLAKKKYPGKGYYSRAVEEAIKQWIHREKKAYIVYRSIELLESGVDL